ncbi:MAG: peptidoglycan editing factor PgeF [Deltaproteobacteria bacterium]|nr:peptidoglycan editing factor PgeF [Deltaproteobacteria bacterium]
MKRVRCLQFPRLVSDDRLIHAVFTREGGVSEAPYNTLNVSYHTDDRPEFVSKNLEIIRDAIGAKDLVFMNQVHGKEILVLRQQDFDGSWEPASADAMITDIPQLALMVKQADCQGVLLFDPIKGVVANVHCGWRGNVINILKSVVDKMKSEFGCLAADLAAAIGPSLGPCCSEFVDYEKIFPEAFRRFMIRKAHFNLWEISRHQLLEAGLINKHIEVAGICTRCRTEMFYSFRGEGETGRFATVIMLKGEPSF